MARAATTADAFNAVAEPARRQILDLLAAGERPVNDLVALLGVAQPQMSKHLAVLRQVGLVEVRGIGRQRWYRLNGYPLKQIHDWVTQFERSWEASFDRLDAVLAELKQAELKQAELKQAALGEDEQVPIERADEENGDGNSGR
ncbi:MAG TPA: metalloregulator ArsR/SmtB family transcription factor [Streptosporangiaceae bacterium]|nr:metalloregulator ArsR/SmtB family transcription factor [Streptosporangiaceae bacterium]